MYDDEGRKRNSGSREAVLQGYIRSGDLMRFYKSREWLDIREEALQRDNYECKQCKAKGRYRHADCVHHKREIKLWPGGALMLSNLVSLCNTCHNIIHGRTPNEFAAGRRKFTAPEKW
jgi:5-methylcytosine-specific restriction endonuclease McrA